MIQRIEKENFGNKSTIVSLGQFLIELADSHDDLSSLIDAYTKAIEKSRRNAITDDGRSTPRLGRTKADKSDTRELTGQKAALFCLAELYAKQSLGADAKKDITRRFDLLEKAMGISKRSATAKTELTKLILAGGENAERARKLYDPFQAEFEWQPSAVKKLLIERNLDSRRYEKAFEQLKLAIRWERSDCEFLALNNRCHLEWDKGDPKRALTAVNNRISRNNRQIERLSNDVDSPIALGLLRIELLMHLKRYGEATDDCEKVLAEEPGHKVAMKKHIECYDQLRKLAKEKRWIE